MTTKKSTKKAIKAVTKKAVVKKPAQAPKTAKKLAESKSAKKPVRRPKPAEPETTKVLAVANGKSNVTVSTTKPVELDRAKAAGLVVEAPDSISPEQAEKIAENRRSHEDERPPNSELTIPELISRAWDEVKGESDPPLNQCAPTHVEKFYSHAQGIIKGNSPQAGDTMLARFEQAVSRLIKEK